MFLKSLYLAAVTSLGLLLSVPAYSVPMGRGSGDRSGRMMSNLNLTKEQKSQLSNLRKTNRNEMKAKYDAVRAKEKELKDELKTNASESVLRAKFKELQDLKAEAASLRFDHLLAIRKILTPDQRKKFRGFMRERYGHHRDHDSWKKGRGHGMGPQNSARGKDDSE